ncbi:MAG: NADPH:quinone oxidoreductase family protein [Hyphomonas sp.]|uniref:NADPH:quinone oxidoreductase family protein n=1 Tax=Hyphomonas sp. TaxID=87 RepID=UPI0017DB46D3|nr:NADPH:quinone oxidoreductase family protein [Hyphomonas sp.]MBU3920289.1 NADPH:quinone oxidoreductase family protein [Alphaproteobacteria bacterium]MBA3069421.1 NADPH:quinone oxidoreductase family protein [Hyphomonas sp.]MBU4063803.1 NADPH:quinone oxidoreductase family protein [Alphaproteobacteria bacterium]MBU4164236.1 NADPH:quinone oxidoreductase family protein [Alphaproteobacteria bacterium]MBU4569497.1 NADPH:quinone oxidoreductase family protein [Alphaproteobacteria bacterium]
MKALVCSALQPDYAGVALEERPVPEPGPSEVRVRIKAASLNFPDLLMTEGKYQFKPDLPFVLGMEFAGEVDALGEGVTDFAPGEAVVGGNKIGAFSEFAVVPAAVVRRKPASISFAAAASYSAAYLTAYVALIRRGNLQPGETLLVHGASGGVGLAAVDVGRLLGAVVIATSASAAKRDILKAYGADHVLPESGFREAVKALTGGRGADVIFDPVGGDVFDESVRCIAFDGRLLVIGFASGRIPSVAVNMPLIKGFSVVGVRAGEYGRRFPERGRENMAAIWKWAEEGKVHPRIHARVPLSDWRRAFDMMRSREVVGKVVIEM